MFVNQVKVQTRSQPRHQQIRSYGQNKDFRKTTKTIRPRLSPSSYEPSLPTKLSHSGKVFISEYMFQAFLPKKCSFRNMCFKYSFWKSVFSIIYVSSVHSRKMFLLEYMFQLFLLKKCSFQNMYFKCSFRNMYFKCSFRHFCYLPSRTN